MSAPTRMLVQSVVAGLVAAAVLAAFNGLPVRAQWGEPAPEPTATQEATPEAATTGTHPCQLVTEAEAEAALGATTTEIADPTQCTYVADDMTGRAVSVASTPALPAEDGAFESGMRQLGDVLGAVPRQVDLGADVEAWVVTSELIAQISALTSDNETVVIVMTAPAGTESALTDALVGMASTALQRL